MAVIHFAVDFEPIPCGASMDKHTTHEPKRVTCQNCLRTKFFRQCDACWEREQYEHDNAAYLRAAANYSEDDGPDRR